MKFPPNWVHLIKKTQCRGQQPVRVWLELFCQTLIGMDFNPERIVLREVDNDHVRLMIRDRHGETAEVKLNVPMRRVEITAVVGLNNRVFYVIHRPNGQLQSAFIWDDPFPASWINATTKACADLLYHGYDTALPPGVVLHSGYDHPCRCRVTCAKCGAVNYAGLSAVIWTCPECGKKWACSPSVELREPS